MGKNCPPAYYFSVHLPSCKLLLIWRGETAKKGWRFWTALFTYVRWVLLGGTGLYFKSSVPVFTVLFHKGHDWEYCFAYWCVIKEFDHVGSWDRLQCCRGSPRVSLLQHSCCELMVAVKWPLFNLESAHFLLSRLVTFANGGTLLIEPEDSDRTHRRDVLQWLVLLVALDAFVYIGGLGPLWRGITFILRYLHMFSSFCFLITSYKCAVQLQASMHDQGTWKGILSRYFAGSYRCHANLGREENLLVWKGYVSFWFCTITPADSTICNMSLLSRCNTRSGNLCNSGDVQSIFSLAITYVMQYPGECERYRCTNCEK